MFNIPNVTIEQRPSGIYSIVPNDGYALHAKGKDYTNIDENGNEFLIRGYTTFGITVAPNYDFGSTTTIDGYTAYGAQEVFARPISEINGTTDKILGGGGNDHEVM